MLVMLNCVPVNVNPVPAVYVPAPENCDQVTAVTPSVPPGLTVHTQPVSPNVAPSWINVNADTNSAQLFASVVLVQPVADAA